jgi:hypothetical protein
MGLYEVFGLIDAYLGKAYLYRYYYLSKRKKKMFQLSLSMAATRDFMIGDTKINKLQVLQTHL